MDRVRDDSRRQRIGELNRRASLDHVTSERDASRSLASLGDDSDRDRRRRMWDAGRDCADRQAASRLLRGRGGPVDSTDPSG